MKKIFIGIGIICTPFLLLVSCSGNETVRKSVKAEAVRYQLVGVKHQAIETTLRLPAQLLPYEAVSIYPRVTGYVKRIPVDIGSEVRKGQVLMELEAPDIEQDAIAAHEKYIDVLANYNERMDEYFRLLKTSETQGAVSPNDLQMARSKMQSDSAMCNSAKASWKATESMKSYLIVTAPFDGTITQRNIHPGALVVVGSKDGKPMLELQEMTRLRLQVSVPESFVSQLIANQQISFVIDALPGKTFKGTVVRQANSVDEKFRSEIVEMDVSNTDKIFMPGMYAEILLSLKGHQDACVAPQSALITSTENKYVIKVVNHKAVFVNVDTGNENNGYVEIFGAVSEGDSLIAKANEDIKPGQHIN